ncbi:tape measure protein [Escherichia coli]|nr:tape measure protein [Escherichia coli]MCW3371914.1 tape measure protein [Escherichia coli]
MKAETGSYVHWLRVWAWPVKTLKAMADDGKLTADKVVPALISQLGVLRDEYAAMPETVSDGITKVENAFMAWVGGANEASGVTKRSPAC